MLAARTIPGVEFEPADWVPAKGFWAGKTLRGVAINVTDPHAFPSVRTAVELLAAARAQGKYHVAPHEQIMDRDWGTDAVRLALDAGTVARRDRRVVAARPARVQGAAREVSAVLSRRADLSAGSHERGAFDAESIRRACGRVRGSGGSARRG